MSLNVIKKVIDLGDGRTIEIETGKLAKQAHGSVVVKMGDTMLLATVVSSFEAKEGVDFLPLSVDYQEKYAATGRIPGGFLRREARLSDYEVLISRLVDRALRPLFPEDYYCEVQVIITLISSDSEIMPDALACLAASAALAVSDIPIKEIISEVRVARVDGEFVVNPSRTQLGNADMDFMVGATDRNLMMVEGESKECSEEDLVKALEIAHEAIKIQVKAQQELRDKLGITGKRDYEKPVQKEDILEKVKSFAGQKIYEISKAGTSKHERSEAFSRLKEELIASFEDEDAS